MKDTRTWHEHVSWSEWNLYEGVQVVARVVDTADTRHPYKLPRKTKTSKKRWYWIVLGAGGATGHCATRSEAQLRAAEAAKRRTK